MDIWINFDNGTKKSITIEDPQCSIYTLLRSIGINEYYRVYLNDERIPSNGTLEHISLEQGGVLRLQSVLSLTGAELFEDERLLNNKKIIPANCTVEQVLTAAYMHMTNIPPIDLLPIIDTFECFKWWLNPCDNPQMQIIDIDFYKDLTIEIDERVYGNRHVAYMPNAVSRIYQTFNTVLDSIAPRLQEYGAIGAGSYFLNLILEDRFKFAPTDIDIFSYSLDLLAWISKTYRKSTIRVAYIKMYMTSYYIAIPGCAEEINYVHVKKIEDFRIQFEGDVPQNIKGLREHQISLVKFMQLTADLSCTVCCFDGFNIYYNSLSKIGVSIGLQNLSGKTLSRNQKYISRNFRILNEDLTTCFGAY